MKSKKISKLFLISVLSIGGIKATYAQQNVGIGTLSPHESAILDLNSNTKGLLLPRMSEADKKAIVSPAKGLMVYQTDQNQGLYIYDGNQWSAAAASEANLQGEEAGFWGLSGNSGTSENNFIGTTDQNSLVFKLNNTFSGKLDLLKGNVFFGYRTGINSLAHSSVAIGAMAMQKSNSSGNNVGIGFQSMFSNENGNHNVALGTGALAANISGSGNIAVGSLAGYKSLGSGNIFLGFQSGYAEAGNNKLIITNDASKKPLIFGDLEQGLLGINTTNLQATLTINSKTSNSSGLRFENFNNNSNTSEGNGKVLSLNNEGDVILVNDKTGASSSTPQFWKVNDDNDLVPTLGKSIRTNQMIYADGISLKWAGVRFEELNSNYPNLLPNNGLALSLNENGNFIFTRLPFLWNTNNNLIRTVGDQKVVIGEGVNKLPDGYSLYVKNGILAERVRVALMSSDKWADYVFDKNYRLMPLNEVEAFIQKNSHLPNVPSAEEVAKGGIDIAEMSAKQMEKIEELTLYMIEANKKIERLEKLLEAKGK